MKLSPFHAFFSFWMTFICTDTLLRIEPVVSPHKLAEGRLGPEKGTRAPGRDYGKPETPHGKDMRQVCLLTEMLLASHCSHICPARQE